MSTFEMICWAILALLVAILVAGTGFLLFSGQASSAESDRLQAEADEEQRRLRARA